MHGYDWDTFDLGKLASELREDPGGAEGERMIWAFEEASASRARGTICFPTSSPRRPACSRGRRSRLPRTVLEGFFRRSASDETWRDRYLPLFH